MNVKRFTYSYRQCNYNITALKKFCMAGRNIGILYIFLNFAHICCCSSSHCGVRALKLIHELSLQASSDSTSDIGIVSFSFSIYFSVDKQDLLHHLPHAHVCVASLHKDPHVTLFSLS